jgi:hypothetical protein
MRYITGGIALAAALGLGCLTAATGSAASAATGSPAATKATTVKSAAEAPHSLYAPTALVLTVGQGDSAQTATVARAVTLSCAPRPSGTHPAPRLACTELRLANGEFDLLTRPEAGQACPHEWNPVTVTATGVWQGHRVSYTHSFANGCLKDAAASTVFSF